MDYDFLIKHFYSVHTSTTAGRDLMNAKDLLSRDMTMKGMIPSPRYLSTTPIPRKPIRIPAGTDRGGRGDYLTRLLEAKGYNVYHDTSVYDLKTASWTRARLIIMPWTESPTYCSRILPSRWC